MIGVIDYRGGNAPNVLRALKRLALPARRVADADQLEGLSGLIFPGVGAAPAAMRELERAGLAEPLRRWQAPFLGLCLGMQLLFEWSAEGDTAGLGRLEGKVELLPDRVVRPHMGWNQLSNGHYAYFVHSYACRPARSDVVTMTTRYGVEICAGVRSRNLMGVQWHPEKSGRAGNLLLKGFAELCS